MRIVVTACVIALTSLGMVETRIAAQPWDATGAEARPALLPLGNRSNDPGDCFETPSNLRPARTSSERPSEFANLLKRLDPPDDPWQDLRYDPGRLKVSRESLVEWAKVQANLDLLDTRELRDAPWRTRNWRAEESLNVPLPVSESLYLFGRLDSEGEVYDNRRLRLTGKTGLGWKWSPFAKSELQLRGGPVVNVSDVYNPIGAQEKSHWSVEMQAKLDLFGPLQLQYSGEALPALIQAERHTLLQDVKLALPFGGNREFHIGAKYRWEDLSATPWLDRAQLYLGLKLQH